MSTNIWISQHQQSYASPDIIAPRAPLIIEDTLYLYFVSAYLVYSHSSDDSHVTAMGPAD